MRASVICDEGGSTTRSFIFWTPRPGGGQSVFLVSTDKSEAMVREADAAIRAAAASVIATGR